MYIRHIHIYISLGHGICMSTLGTFPKIVWSHQQFIRIPDIPHSQKYLVAVNI